MNYPMPVSWIQDRQDARRIETIVWFAGPVVAILDLRRQLPDLPPERFDAAVLLLLDERRVVGFCDRDLSTILSTEQVSGICFLARRSA